MNLKKRIIIILIIYVIVVLIGILMQYGLESRLSPLVFENPTISIKTFLDDFINIKISCYWDKKPINIVVKDEFSNIWHNSSPVISCKGYKELNLQGQPQDYRIDRKYIVELNFDNQTINSGYFYFKKYNFFGIVQREAFSFFHFSIYENRLARGSYSDSQRLLYAATKNPIYAENYIRSHLAGLIYTFVILLSINLLIWLFVFLSKMFKRKK